jgi:RNA polymerase sigma-70 factor, ECF subfamily
MWVCLAVLGGDTAFADAEAPHDRDVLARLARRDRDALATLYDRHARRLFSLALRIVGARDDAEDVIQEVFSQAWDQAGRYDGSRGSVTAWLVTITRSRAIDHVRARRARPDSHVLPDDAAPAIADPGAGQEAMVLTGEQVSRVRRALDALPLLQRTAIELAYYEGLSQSDIAERLEQPLGTIKTRMRQGLSRLREALQAKP